MTKTVRIENADNSPYKVIVEIWDKSFEPGKLDTMVSRQVLGIPTAMTEPGTYITSTRYIVVREATPEDAV